MTQHNDLTDVRIDMRIQGRIITWLMKPLTDSNAVFNTAGDIYSSRVLQKSHRLYIKLALNLFIEWLASPGTAISRQKTRDCRAPTRMNTSHTWEERFTSNDAIKGNDRLYITRTLPEVHMLSVTLYLILTFHCAEHISCFIRNG